VAEAVVGFTGVKINQNDSAAKIASALADHRKRVLLLAYLSVLYAAAFPIYLSKLHRLLRGPADRAGFLAPLVLIGGTVFVVLHAVSDVGIYALLGAKLATYGAQHDHGLSYALYLMTFALDSVGDLFGSLFALATGVLILRSGPLPRWLGWTAMLVAALLFLQAFTLGGVVTSFGLGIDGVGFVLLLIFVLVSSIILLRRESSTSATAPATT
jgi:uncharacterized protein DUF4386